MRLLPAWLRVGGIYALLGVASCADAVQGTAPAAEERFAREYFKTLADSGVEAIAPRTLGGLGSKVSFRENMEVLRGVLRRVPPDSLLLERWKVEVSPGKPRATKIVYAVHGLDGPFLVGLWIEPDGKHLGANTVFFGSPPAKGRLPGDS